MSEIQWAFIVAGALLVVSVLLTIQDRRKRRRR